MRKYFQITFVLGVFGILVVLRQLKGNEQPVIVGNIQQSSGSSSTPAPASSSGSSSTTPTTGGYKNGTYVGSVQDAFYGNIQVQAVISNGKITAVNFSAISK